MNYSLISEILSQFGSEFVALTLSLTGTILVFIFRPKVKLIYGRATSSFISIPVDDNTNNNMPFYVEKFFVKNTGRLTTNDIEFVLSNEARNISIWPPRQIQRIHLDDYNYMLKIPHIAPKELVTIDCVYIHERAFQLQSVKSAEVLGKLVPFVTQRAFPMWVNYLIGMLIILGTAICIQLLFLFSS